MARELERSGSNDTSNSHRSRGDIDSQSFDQPPSLLDRMLYGNEQTSDLDDFATNEHNPTKV